MERTMKETWILYFIIFQFCGSVDDETPDYTTI